MAKKHGASMRDTIFDGTTMAISPFLTLLLSFAMSPLATRYLERLEIGADDFDYSEPSLETLKLLQARHLAKVPFENTAQHGVTADGPASLDLQKTARKILDRKRGGFCFELNGLFARFLSELGYSVTLVPAIVYTDEGFRGHPTHVIIFVRCSDGALYYSDVGFGEPPIHPLKYEFDSEQRTAEGMRSRFVQDGQGTVVLEWMKEDKWHPRLKWDHSAALLGEKGPQLTEFTDNLDKVLDKSSIFSHKMICCLLTETQKITLAGNRLKITEPRQFPKQKIEPQVKVLADSEDARRVLYEHFGVPLSSSEGLDLSKSIHAEPTIWSHM